MYRRFFPPVSCEVSRVCPHTRARVTIYLVFFSSTPLAHRVGRWRPRNRFAYFRQAKNRDLLRAG